MEFQLPIIGQSRHSSALGKSLNWSPSHPDIHLVDSDRGPHVLLVDGSRVFEVGADDFAMLDQAVSTGNREPVDGWIESHGLSGAPFVDEQPLQSPPLRSLSLAVAQKCNLACTYCYASEGSFGSAPRNMSHEVALAAVERLFRDARSDERVRLSFLGGEPLLNRAVVHAATEAAVKRSLETGVRVGFSITTNGTLIEEQDVEFFEHHSFAVTISVDGIGDDHDKIRPSKGGGRTFERIMERILPLLRRQKQMQVSARL